MDLSTFQVPPKTSRPMVRWWWPGLDVEKDELLRELDDLDQSGIGGAEIQPFMIGLPLHLERTDPERARRTHRFMQPYHYEMLSAILDGAEHRELTIDITQNSAWPTGGVHISLEDSHQTLLFGETTVSGPRVYDQPVPPLKPLRLYAFAKKIVPLIIPAFRLMDYYPQDKKLVRVVAGKLTDRKGKFTSWKIKESTLLELDSMIDLTGQVDASGRLKWQVPPGSWQVFAFYAGTAGAHPLMDARNNPRADALVVDHFNRAAIRRHLQAFIGTGKATFGRHFGNTLRAIFTDSFELLSPMHWTGNFLAEFRRRRGYDVSPYLPVTYVPLKDVGYFTYSNELNLPNFDFTGNIGQRIRYDVQRTLSELFIEEFIDGVADWATENNLLSRVQGYGMLADPLQMLGRSHIPETEQLYGGGALHFLKLTGSAASLYNRPIVSSETLVWQGRPYLTTPLKWRVGIDRLFESGINQVIYHGFPYRHPEFPYPGYQPFASPFTPLGTTFSTDMSRDNPLLFNSAPTLNAYATRAQYVLQHSKTRATLGIFYQLFDYPNGSYIREELVQGVLDDHDAQLPKANPLAEVIMSSKPPSKGDRLWMTQSAALGDELVANGWYYQFFNEDSLLKSTVSQGKVVMGEAEFAALLLFKETRLPAAVAEKLQQLSTQGIPVLFVGSKPEQDPGYTAYPDRDQQVKAAIAAIDCPLMESHDQVIAALKNKGIAPQLVYQQPENAFGFIYKQDREAGSDFIFIRNRSRQEQSLSVQIKAGNHQPVELDLWSGTASRLRYERPQEEHIELNLTFSGYTSRLIALLDAKAAASLPLAEREWSATHLHPVQEIRDFSFSAAVRQANGDLTPIPLKLTDPVDWRTIPQLSGLGSPGVYQTEFTLDNKQPGTRYFLCFERVCDRADIQLNETTFPPLLVMPWRCEVTGVIREGRNTLKITVIPTLRNALVAYGNAGERLYRQYRNQPTQAAGLIGPVRVCKLSEG